MATPRSREATTSRPSAGGGVVTRLDRITALARELAYVSLASSFTASKSPPRITRLADVVDWWAELDDKTQQRWLLYAHRIEATPAIEDACPDEVREQMRERAEEMGVGVVGPAPVDGRGR